jgi:hypothetical protein
MGLCEIGHETVTDVAHTRECTNTLNQIPYTVVHRLALHDDMASVVAIN